MKCWCSSSVHDMLPLVCHPDQSTPVPQGLRKCLLNMLPFPPPGDHPNPGIEPTSLVFPTLAGGTTQGSINDVNNIMIIKMEKDGELEEGGSLLHRGQKFSGSAICSCVESSMCLMNFVQDLQVKLQGATCFPLAA